MSLSLGGQAGGHTLGGELVAALREREFEDYLKCGILEFGLQQLGFRECGHSELAALSCKRRGFCPSCLARRMSDTAVHLERSVLPEVPIRHWPCD